MAEKTVDEAHGRFLDASRVGLHCVGVLWAGRARVDHPKPRAGQQGLAILGGTFLLSLALAIRARRDYIFPIAMGILAVLVWLELGTAYGGDCGGTAHDSGVCGAVLGIGALASQVLRERLRAQRPRAL